MNPLSISPDSSRAHSSSPSSWPFLQNNKRWWLRINSLLNKLSYLVAIAGIAWYSILLASGEYFTWGIPLLSAAAVCKLFTTSSPEYDTNNIIGKDSGGLSNNNFRKRSHDKGYKYLAREDAVRSSRSSSRARRIIRPVTCYHRIQRYFLPKNNKVTRTLHALYQSTRRKLTNDNHYNLLFLSTLILLVPCSTYLFQKLIGHLSDFKEAGSGINHKKLANDFGKFGAAAFSFLLLPVSKHSSLLGSLGLGEVHALRLHISAGFIVLVGGIVHGLYYTYIWIEMNGYHFKDVFPNKECVTKGVFHEEYDKDCHSSLINLLGIISGISLVILGVSSLYWVRRKFYRVFYILHILISILVLFGLVMHYNKMIYYMAPSLLYYMASNMPIYMESWNKWHGWEDGVGVSKVVCIPDSGGCVELTLCSSNCNNNNHRRGVDGSNSSEISLHSYQNTVGKYIKLQIPEISMISHPFTIFANPNDTNTLRILVRPCGSFTTALSKRLRALTLLPEPTPSEIENHSRTFFSTQSDGSGSATSSFLQSRRERECPKMLVNGIRSGTILDEPIIDLVERHDRIVIIAGGVGIVSYISLIHALKQLSVVMNMKAGANDTMNGKVGEENDDAMLVNNHRRMIYSSSYDESDNEEGNHGFEQDNENNVDQNIENGECGIAAALDQQQHAKCRIDIHWMSRDEGLIRHVMENYFEPFCTYRNGVGDASTFSSKNSSMMSINIMVHHTSPNYEQSSLSMSPNSVANNILTRQNSDSEPTTWQPSQDHHVVSMNTAPASPSGEEETFTTDSTTSSSYSFASSKYQGSKPSPSQNILAAVTFASIAYGGSRIVDYCYNSIQDKHVVETRPIAVVGILILALAVSVASNAIVLVGIVLLSKLSHFRYTKLESGNGDGGGVGADDSVENGNGDIECSPTLDSNGNGNMAQQHQQEQQQQFSISDDDEENNVLNGHDPMSSEPHSQQLELQASPVSSNSRELVTKNNVMNTSHSQGRPNLESIVQDAMKKKEDSGQEMDGGIDEGNGHHAFGSNGMGVGIFMCGPTAMTNFVWDAIKKEERKKGVPSSCCKGGTSMVVYQENFEL